MKKKKVFIILGPTSSGKTSLALDLCRKYNGEIVSVDSRQIYKGMDIGTGKIPVDNKIVVEKGDGLWVLDGIKIWGYDLTTLDVFFSGYNFALFALAKTKEILKSGRNVFLVGGTGFYIDLFTGKVKPSKVKPDLGLRDSLNSMSLGELQVKLSKLNPEVFKKIDEKNKIRLVRAIEREVSKEVNEKNLSYIKNCDFIYIGLNAPREILHKKSDLWVDRIFEVGVTSEVKNLLKPGYKDCSKLGGLVYKSVVQLINGELSKDAVVQQAKYDVHKYIKRQITYFRKNKDVFWVDVSKDDYRKIIYNKVERELRDE